jgi:aminopeptidase N
MENWGAITYRETALLYDSQNSAATARQRIVEAIAHEMAHVVRRPGDHGVVGRPLAQ